MKRFLLILTLCLLCAGLAAAESTVTDRIYPTGLDAQSGADQLYRLLDGDASTCWSFVGWTSVTTDDTPEASFWFNGETLGSVWIRTGDCRSAEAYYGSAVPTSLRLRVYTGYSAADYSYTLSDIFDLSSVGGYRSAGYECLTLPAAHNGVTRVELFITGWRRGSSYANSICVSDILFSRSGGTAPAPNPHDWTPPVSGGIRTTLSMRLATRSGPSTKYTELGSYFRAGDPITVLSRAYDSGNGIWWVQVEFNYQGVKRRAYTGLKRVNLDASLIPEENFLGYATVLHSAVGYYGPGSSYTRYKDAVPGGTYASVYNAENGYVQLEFKANDTQKKRVWVSVSDVSLSWDDIIY